MKVSFVEIFEDVTKYGAKISKDSYLTKGKYPIIDQGQNYIAGYSNEKNGVFTDVPAIVFGDHTRIIKYIDFPCFLGADGVKLLKTKNNIWNYKYLYYSLCYNEIPNTGYNRHYKYLKEISINYYGIDEQTLIANKLDQINHLIDIKKTELIYFEQIVKSRFIEMFGDNTDTEKTTINNVCSIITDGTHQPPKFQQEGIPFLFVSNIAQNKITYNTEKFISEKTYNELIKRTPIEIGDVLLSTVGSYGHPAIVKKDYRFLFQRHIAYLKPKHDVINSIYLYGAILSPSVQKQIDERVKGIAQKTLNLSEIRKIIIPLPKISKQNQFANSIEQVDKSKLAIEKSIEKLEILKKSLMQKYFG